MYWLLHEHAESLYLAAPLGMEEQLIHKLALLVRRKRLVSGQRQVDKEVFHMKLLMQLHATKFNVLVALIAALHEIQLKVLPDVIKIVFLGQVQFSEVEVQTKGLIQLQALLLAVPFAKRIFPQL